MSQEKRRNIFTRTLGWVFKGNYRVKIFFLILSFFLWSLIKLSKPGYIKDYSFPLEFVNLPQNQLLVNQPPNSLKVSLKGDGFILLKYRFTGFKPLSINLEKLPKRKPGRYYWLPAEHRQELTRQLADEVEIINLRPDSLIFEMSRLSEKKVPVKAQIDIDKDLGFKLYQAPAINPDSVLLSGPPELLNPITQVFTQTWEISEKSGESQMEKLKLKLPKGGQIKSNVTAAEVRVSLARITEEVLQTSIAIENVPDSLQVELFPKTVQIRYRVALRDYEKVKPEELSVFVNFQEAANNPERRYLTLQLEEKPEYIEAIFLDPKRVEFIATPK